MVSRNTVEPGAEGGASLKAAKGFVGLEEDLLRRIFRYGRIAEYGSTKPDDPGMVFANEGLKSFASAGLCLAYKVKIFFGLHMNANAPINSTISLRKNRIYRRGCQAERTMPSDTCPFCVHPRASLGRRPKEA